MTAERILVSHAGTLPRPDGLKERLVADPGSPDVQKELAAAVADVVRKQADMGIDIVNDGEFSKVRGFSEYVRDRLGGLAGVGQRQLSVMARDATNAATDHAPNEMPPRSDAKRSPVGDQASAPGHRSGHSSGASTMSTPSSSSESGAPAIRKSRKRYLPGP